MLKIQVSDFSFTQSVESLPEAKKETVLKLAEPSPIQTDSQRIMLSQSFYLSMHNIDLLRLRNLRKPRHTHDVSGNSHNHFRTAVDYEIPYSCLGDGTLPCLHCQDTVLVQ